jgi:hypothetical protein
LDYQFKSLNMIIKKETKSIHLTHKYTTAHFPGLVRTYRHFNKNGGVKLLTKNKRLFRFDSCLTLQNSLFFFHLILFSYFIDFVSFRYMLFSYFTYFVVSFRWISFSYFTDFIFHYQIIKTGS